MKSVLIKYLAPLIALNLHAMWYKLPVAFALIGIFTYIRWLKEKRPARVKLRVALYAVLALLVALIVVWFAYDISHPGGE